MLVLGLVVLGAAGGAAWFLTHGKPADGAAEHKPAKIEPPVFVVIEPFTVNLQPENGDQYLQIQFTLQVANAENEEKIKLNMPKVRSRLLLLLSAKKASELNTVEGKKLLSSEIVAAIKAPFAEKGEPQAVTDVLFTSFIIQ
ncbi:MAG: flagellar basal body-associated protein FliL [Pseudomonadota bacterium]